MVGLMLFKALSKFVWSSSEDKAGGNSSVREAHAELKWVGGIPSLPSSSFPNPCPQSELCSLMLVNALVRAAIWEPQALFNSFCA